jgi:hypothetical protein
MNRATTSALLASVALLAAASPAAAATFRAEKSGAGTACSPAAPCSTIDAALAAARASAGPDTVEIGPGIWDERVQLSGALHDGDTIVGAGSGVDASQDTIIRADGGHAVLGSAGASSAQLTLRGVRLRGVGDFGTWNLLSVHSPGALIEDVAVEGTMRAASDAVSVNSDATLNRVNVGVFDGAALATRQGAAVTVRDSTLRLVAIDPVFDRPAVDATGEGQLALIRTTVTTASGSFAAVDAATTFRSESSVIAGGWLAAVRHRGGIGGATLLNTTLDAGHAGLADDGPVALLEDEAEDVVVRSSIAVERFRGTHSGGRIECSYSSTPVQVEAPSPGSAAVACGAAGGNIAVASPEALFRNPILLDYRLLATAPAIDAGDPAALGAGESATDLAGNPRIAQPRADCAGPAARRDQGAFETDAGCIPPGEAPPGSGSGDTGGSDSGGSHSGDGGGSGGPGLGGGGVLQPADNVAPVLSGVRLVPGRATSRRLPGLRLRLSEAATLRIAIRRGRKTVAAGSVRLAEGARSVSLARVLRRRGLRSGRYRLEVTAIDAAGNRSAPRTLALRSR